MPGAESPTPGTSTTTSAPRADGRQLRDLVQWVITCFALLTILFGWGSVRDVYRALNRSGDTEKTAAATARREYAGKLVSLCDNARSGLAGTGADAVTRMRSAENARWRIAADWTDPHGLDDVGDAWSRDVDTLRDDYDTQTDYLDAALVSYQARDWPTYALAYGEYQDVGHRVAESADRLLGSRYLSCFRWQPLPERPGR